MNHIKLSILAIISVFILSCASPGVTPDKANLFQAVGNILSGEFDRQQKQKESQYEEQENQLATARGNRYMLNESVASEHERKEELEQALENLKHENSKLEYIIARLHTKTEVDKKKKADLVKQLSTLNKKLDQLTNNQSTVDGEQYLSKIEILKKEIEVLRNAIKSY